MIAKKGDANNTSHSNFTRDMLVRLVYNDIVNGAVYSNLIDKIMTDGYNVGRTYGSTTAYLVVSTARKLVKKDWEEDRKTLKETLYATYMDMYAEARKAKDRYSAISCLKELAKLGGAYEPDKVDVSIDGDIEINFGFDN